LQWIKQALSPLIGEQAEKLAKQYLEEQGLVCLMQNYRCRSGEIDLVMRDHQTLVFIEVKYRSRSDFGAAIEYFHASKRRKFESAIAHYLHQHKLNPSQIDHRIDIIGLDANVQGQTKYTWLQNV
jgi:putative endonuclease